MTQAYTHPKPAPRTPAVTTASTAEDFRLTAQDRCDTCRAQAYFEVSVLTPESKPVGLLFCAHHFHKSEDQLRSIAVSIRDESARLLGGLG